MTADSYIRLISEPHVVPFAPYIGPSFHVMHDNVAFIFVFWSDQLEVKT